MQPSEAVAQPRVPDGSHYHLFGVRAVAGAYSCLMYSLTIRLVQKRGAMVLILSLTM